MILSVTCSAKGRQSELRQESEEFTENEDDSDVRFKSIVHHSSPANEEINLDTGGHSSFLIKDDLSSSP